MKNIRSLVMRCVMLSLLGLLLCACVQNKPHRTQLETGFCFEADCSSSYLERHLIYDLSFIEFTERGNLYDRKAARTLFQHIADEAAKDAGVAVFVFAHGWKHNAAHDDENVVQFRDFLIRAAENEIVGKRKVIGLYLGWRGKHNKVPLLKETTYWARKSVAEEIGDGGATEIFVELKQLLIDSRTKDSYKNTFVIIGHSFGGSLVLSAIHDLFLHDLVEARKGQQSSQAVNCAKVSRFADGVILINPAIEANRIVLLREASARCTFSNEQPTLMRILASDGDTATQKYFPIGQSINITSTNRPKKLIREISGKKVVLDERKLDQQTVGNLKQLRTAYLSYDLDNNVWQIDHCLESLNDCGIGSSQQQKNHIPTTRNDPIEFIKTDSTFIKNHNDVFGCYTQAFITASMLETQAIDTAYGSRSLQKEILAGCGQDRFELKRCFNSQVDAYECAPPK